MEEKESLYRKIMSLYVEYGPNMNTAILCKTGHTKGLSPVREGWQKKEVKKVNIVDVLAI
jgi:hypothetical protein